MWEFGTAAAAIVALLAPAAPGQAPPPLRPPDPVPCIVPIGGALDGCPRDELGAPVLCIVPVTGLVPMTGRVPAPPEPDCPEPVPDARARIVPISP